MQNEKIFVNQSYYHLYNRGVAKQKIFSEMNDCLRLLKTFGFYLDDAHKTKLSEISKKEFKIINLTEPKKPLVEIICFCLMPNHFHLLIKQLIDNGISTFIRRSLDSYTRYYNRKHDRVGPLFQGRFKSVPVESDEYILHLSRYIHLNPFSNKLAAEADEYPWSSYNNYLRNQRTRICHPKFLLDLLGSTKEYHKITEDYKEYTQSLEEINKLLIEKGE